MNPTEFVSKWRKVRQKEISVSQSHFNDVCALVEHPTPLEIDPDGNFFTFEEAAVKTSGDKGRADVWYQGKFIWEYKGHHKNLDKAYQQLQLYREALGNPPLLITSDTQTIIIHTNFINTLKQVYRISFDDLIHGAGLDTLKRAFNDPMSLMPSLTQQQVTQASADAFVSVAEALQMWALAEGRSEDPEQLAHFVIRLLFSMFSEDLGILPDNIFTNLVSYQVGDIDHLTRGLRNLFGVMRSGGDFGQYPVPNFDGGLFDDDFVPDLPGDIHHRLRDAARQDWAGTDPAIFGTLFERIIDQSKRAQLGTHFTSKEDILLIVEPVLMKPLRDEWQEIRNSAIRFVREGDLARAHEILSGFSERVASVKVLDPACGSGNFLYVSLRQLLDLQKEVIVHAARADLDGIPLTVDPGQLYGIEINPYAHELAQITVWIGYYQWRFENGFLDIDEPILKPLDNISRQDALIAYDESSAPQLAVWPEADVIIGNPPFLGGKKLRIELTDQYVDHLFEAYEGIVPNGADLVCYWFEQASRSINSGKAKRAGLLATNSIRGGVNRHVLETIKERGDIFMAWSDRPWILDGAAVRVSMIGFDSGIEKHKTLDNQVVLSIHSDLTARVDLTLALSLPENEGLSFMGDTPVGPFEIDKKSAMKMLDSNGNPNGRPNSDVIKPWVIGLDVTRRPRDAWIIDFGRDMAHDEAAKYLLPYSYVREHVKPFREKARSGDRTGVRWWIHQRPRPAMRDAIKLVSKYIATPAVSKHRVFAWFDNHVLPDHALLVFPREDDYFFGVLQSHSHEIWSLRLGTSLESRPRYTPTTSFETFPFPWIPGEELDESSEFLRIAKAASDLYSFLEAWLHPLAEDIGTVISERAVRRRTRTNIYNALLQYRNNIKGITRDQSAWNESVRNLIELDKIEAFDYLHDQLDRAVCSAYGWEESISDDQILANLLALNLQRAASIPPAI